MYIPEFLCGVAATLIAEFAAAMVVALATAKKGRKECRK